MRWLFLKVDPPAPPPQGNGDWGGLLKELLENPLQFAQQYLLWIIAFLLLLYLLQRLNNNLEVQGVNRAIFLSRAVVGTFTAFIITPAVFILFFNVVALANGLPTINLIRIWDWIYLTLTSYWWLLRCFFNSADIPYMDDLYDGNSIVRILWITVPISGIWLYSAETAVRRWMVLPFLVAVLFFTRHREAEKTFLTDVLAPNFPAWFEEPKPLPAEDPVGGTVVLEEQPAADTAATNGSNGGMSRKKDFDEYFRKNRHLLNAGVIVLLAVSLVVGLFFKKTLIGTMMAVAAIGIFFVFDQGQAYNWHSTGKSPPERQAERDLLIQRFVEEARLPSPDSVLLSLLSTKINKSLLEDERVAPDSLCAEFRDYFSESCRRR